MQRLTTMGISEGKATEAIMDACRANESRQPKGGVTFMLCADGSHTAALRDENGIVVALANVDEFDN